MCLDFHLLVTFSGLLSHWLGHQTCKNRRPYNLYCVGADGKTMLNQSINLLSRVVVAMCLSVCLSHTVVH